MPTRNIGSNYSRKSIRVRKAVPTTASVLELNETVEVKRALRVINGSIHRGRA